MNHYIIFCDPSGCVWTQELVLRLHDYHHTWSCMVTKFLEHSWSQGGCGPWLRFLI